MRSDVGHSILVPLDGSPGSESVLPTVGELARARGARVRLLRVAAVPPEVRFGDRVVAYADQEAVYWVNQTGGTAHVMFGKDSGIQFYLGKGNNRVKFTTAGAYEYTVHVSATKTHAHTGTVVVK